MTPGIIAALLIALVITTVASLVFGKRSWATALLFFLFVFLGLWTVSIYLRNVGPVHWGIAWLPMLFAAVALALLVMWIVPDANRWRDESLTHTETTTANNAAKARHRYRSHGPLFWILIVVFIIAIFVGMLNPQMAL
jgi:hypothetical protein